jgi:hypothetical protein
MSAELFNSRQGKEIFAFLKASILALGSSNLMFNIGVWEGPCAEVMQTERETDHSCRLVPRLRMLRALPVPLFLLYGVQSDRASLCVVVTYSARSQCCGEGLPFCKHVVITEWMATERDVACVLELGLALVLRLLS